MHRLLTIVVVSAALAALCSTAGWGAVVFADAFEPSVNTGVWPMGPSGWGGVLNHNGLLNDTSHIRTPGTNAARASAEYRQTYNNQHRLPSAYGSNVYLKFWMFEDNDITYYSTPPPGHSDEEWPNGYAGLFDTTTPAAEAFVLGVMGEPGRTSVPKNAYYFYNCCAYTTYASYYPFDLNYGRPRVQRRQGWRKYTILVNGYTGAAGDVQFAIDDKIYYSGYRASVPGGGAATIDTIIVGSKWWTFETYWYDQVEFGTIEAPVTCSTIQQAKAQPDGTWVNLDPKVVAGVFIKSPLPGYLALEESNRTAGLWVSSSYPALVNTTTNKADKIGVVGMMRTNEAGMRYLDAIRLTTVTSNIAQPAALGTVQRNISNPMLQGVLVRVWGKVKLVPGTNPPSAIGQERTGDWRRYILVDDGTSGGPLKCYYGNIESAVSPYNPIPTVKNGDYVSVTGVAGREVLVPGSTGAEQSVWIRGTGDLKILLSAP